MPGSLTAVYAFTLAAIPVAITALLILAFGVYVVWRRFTSVSAAFFTMTAAVAIWMTSFTFMYASHDAETALLWARRAYFGVPFIPPAIYWFTVEFLRIERRRRLLHVLAWSVAAFFSAIAVLTEDLIPRVEQYWFGFYPRYSPGVGAAFLLFFFGYLIASLVEFIRAYPRARGTEKLRIRSLLIAFAIAYLGSVDYLPKYGVAAYPFGYAAILGFVLVAGRTIRRYDLMPLTPSLAAPEIIGTMADVLFVCDREGRIEFANRAAATILGYPESELAGRSINELLATEADLSAKLQRRSLRNDEHVFSTADGERVELTLSIAPVVHDGVPAGAVIIGRDMRDRRRAEREVLQAVTLLQSTLDSTADGILVIGADNRILTYNRRFVEMWHIPQQVMDSGDDRRALEFIVQQLASPDEVVRHSDLLITQPEAESFDILDMKDGRRFERYSIGRRLEEEMIRVWSFRDVTARFAAEAALRESEIRYRLLFEQNAAGVCVSRLDGVIVDCNSTFAAMLGYKRADLVGVSMTSLYANASEALELTTLLRSVDTTNTLGTLNSVEIELRRSDNRALWVLENIALVGDSITGLVHATVVDISDRKRAEEQIEFHAYHDVLTHLPNRKLFTDRLRHGLTRAKRNNRPLAVMFIDVDHFKTVNDTLGHTAGDELLLEMARRLRECVREDDTVARLGGDEFTIILSELSHPEDAISVAQKILAAVQEPITILGMPIVASASIGIALYPEDGLDPESLLRNADSAMYRAKDEGRNTYQLCTDEMKQHALERLAVESRLRTAVRDQQLFLVYQPQINLLTGRTIGVEALVRWNDPMRGVVEPASFIPIAEETRLILPLGEWVLRTACHQMKEWHDRGAGPMRIAVNLSARQFQQHDLVDMVRRVLEETGLGPSSLDLEITETTAMQNAEATVDTLHALRALGVGISIDDFGMGYSSLNYLKRFPLNAVKIDRAFVNDIASSNGDAAIVSAVIGMARSLRLRVLAEGVETAEQFAFLRSRECDEAQGYYFSRPISAEEMTRMLIERRAFAVREPRMTV
ncbi:MAG TPA: EAL domain-containing protein [Thermoanaerobaculia bacterium]|jgi:diguanylate cyclase (GGDEF)-like protein/PAS domain S-box-containing protein|nr:EAL domain-containing protein [Thermoanaerobaculia bacterium]